MRHPPRALTPEYVLEKVALHVARHAPDVEFVPLNGMLPSKTPMDSPYNDLGVPAFVVPYANADEANHAPNENLKIECFIDGIKSGSALLAELGKLGRR